MIGSRADCCDSPTAKSLNIVVPKSSLKVEGQPKVYLDFKTDSGNTNERNFCPNCGS
jgi:hypothetical protein